MSFSGAAATLVGVFVGPYHIVGVFRFLFVFARRCRWGSHITGEGFTCQRMVQVVIGEYEGILLILRGSNKVAAAFLAIEHRHYGGQRLTAEDRSLRNHLRVLVGAKMSDQTDIRCDVMYLCTPRGLLLYTAGFDAYLPFELMWVTWA